MIREINKTTNIDHLEGRELYIWLQTNENKANIKMVAKFINDSFLPRKNSYTDP